MGDLESLLLVLAAIYLAECVVWVRRGGVALCRYWGKNWRLCHPGTVFGNQRGALLLANPLPLLGDVFPCQQFPISLSPQAAYSFTAACVNPLWRPIQPARYIRFADLRAVEVEGKKIFIDGECFLKTPSTSAARYWANVMDRLRKLPAEQRESTIRKIIKESFDEKKIRARLGEYQLKVRRLRLVSMALFVYLFVLAPALLARFGFGNIGWIVLAALLIQMLAAALLFRSAHGSISPRGREERFTPFVTMLLAVPTAIRAHDFLARHLFEQAHPLALARVLCEASVFKTFARQTLLDLRFPILPLSPVDAPERADTEQWFRGMVLEAAENFVSNEGFCCGDLVAPPARSEPANTAFCPRCGAQFTVAEGGCADCGGRPRERFSSAVV